MPELLTLRTDSLPGDIEIHSDLLSLVPSALSRKRASKVGKEKQNEMEDKKGSGGCILCNPDLKPPGTNPIETVIRDRVADFLNDFPYMPGDQRVIFLWHKKKHIRKKHLHRFRLKDLRKIDLYWLLHGCIKRGNQYIKRGKQFRKPDSGELQPELLLLTPDLTRMVVGFNLGKLAGQSLPHFHAQYGWEVVLKPRSFSQAQLDVYFEELKKADLIIYRDEQLKVIVPWTPMGNFALDLYFANKYDLCELNEKDMRVFASLGHAIIQKYLDLGIQNLNIVFTNSPYGKHIEPLIVHFVPRVNMTALYEIKGVNVVDTPPSMIAEEFRRSSKGVSKNEDINWSDWSKLVQEARNYDPESEFKLTIKKVKAKPKKKLRPKKRKRRPGKTRKLRKP